MSGSFYDVNDVRVYHGRRQRAEGILNLGKVHPEFSDVHLVPSPRSVGTRLMSSVMKLEKLPPETV